jgi:predicted transcriptional regulator
MSVRARAREIYGEMAAGEGVTSSSVVPSTPLPNPPPQGGREQTEQAARAEPHSPAPTAPDLTARARALYETSAVPVREIARLCGVTERTIYKYAAKDVWTKRYRRSARDARGDATAPLDFTPVKGAGGRFIRREDRDKPIARGLKATDPAGRARALAACRKAQRLSRASQAKAAAEARAEELIRALDFSTQCFKALRVHRSAFLKGRKPTSVQLRIEGLFIAHAEAALRRLEALLPAQPPAPAPPPPPSPAPSPPPRYDPDDFRAWQ